jgi:Cof subfamily protein (haloacid dehalogenase superfamily)
MTIRWNEERRASCSRIGLLLVDIDGTLVGAGNSVHPTTWPAIRRAQAAGVHVAICTGRPCSGHAAHYANEIGVDVPQVFHSGAVVCTPRGEIVHATTMESASFERLVHFARRNGEALESYTATGCFVERHSVWTERHVHHIGLDVEVRDLLTITDPIVRVQWVVPWEEWPHYESFTAADPGLQISVATQPDMVETCFSSVTAQGISKASAAEALARHHGLGLDQVAMIGDGDNDLDVVGVVGLGIAMGLPRDTPTPRLAALAHVQVASVDEGGLAEAIELALANG